MDSMYDQAGAQASAAFHGVLWSLGLPLIVALAGIAWRIHRVAEDGAVRPLAFYILSLFVIVWLLKPVPNGPPRFVAWIDDACGLAVRRSILAVNRDFLSKPFEYERRMALLEAVRVQDPSVREELHVFFATCAANAMARSDEVEPDNPLRPGTRMNYGGLHFGRTSEACDRARARIWDAVHNDAIDAWFSGHRFGASHDDILDAIVDNEWHGRTQGSSEMAMVRGAVGDYDAVLDRESIRRVEAVRARYRTGVDFMDDSIEALAGMMESAKGTWGMAGQVVGDMVTSRQRYYAVTAYAPTTYGLILMLLTAFFPVAGLWSLFPGKWTALVNFAKVYVSVKLWPLGWSILTAFSLHRPEDPAETSHIDVFVAVSLLYVLVPGLTFLVVNAAARAAAAPFAEAPVVGPSNGPVGQAAAMAAGRVR